MCAVDCQTLQFLWAGSAGTRFWDEMGRFFARDSSPEILRQEILRQTGVVLLEILRQTGVVLLKSTTPV